MKQQDFWFLVGCIFFSRFAPEWVAALIGALAFLLTLLIHAGRLYFKWAFGMSGGEFDTKLQDYADR